MIKIVNNSESQADFVWIGTGALRARILRFGATLQDLRLDPFANPLVLSLPDEIYRGAGRGLFAGAVVGRVAGRIANGRTQINGASLRLPVNAPPHHLHGGTETFAHQNWSFEHVTETAVTLMLDSPAGSAGYPGDLRVTARYEVTQDAVLRLQLEARSTALTLLNLCHHPYFNLDGAATIHGHSLDSPAQHYLPADETALPTGEIAQVAGTEFDFRKPRGIADTAYDHSLCLHRKPTGPLAYAARLRAGPSAPEMEIWTTQPALHIYDGRTTGEVEGMALPPRAAVALEAQGWPDAPNRAAFPSITLQPESLYSQTTEYRFFV